ncbi:MAG: TonB-dependent receptor [Acidobacteria bacterium]|nr:TonB-dependent receptor [Acidobacteriota bacterium]
MSRKRVQQLAAALLCMTVIHGGQSTIQARVLGQDSPGADSRVARAISGVVVDTQGRPVAGASVVLRSATTGNDRIRMTDHAGEFVFPGVGAGRYEVVATIAGFSPAAVDVPASGTAPLRVVLEPRPYQETITVTSAARDVTTRDTSGVPVVVVAGEALRDSAIETVGEALRGVAGVVTRRGSEGTAAAGEQIQGIDSRQVLLLVDGQPIVGARGVKSGVVNLDRESVSRLDRVEVVKGASSAVYGSDAIGGVINLITREPRRPLEASLRLSGGDFGVVDTAADLGVRRSKGTMFFSVGRHTRDSFDLTPSTLDTTGASLERNDLTVRGTTQPNASWRLTGTATGYWNTQVGRATGETGPEQSNVSTNSQTFAGTATLQIDPVTSAEFRAYRGRYRETATGFLLNATQTPLTPGDLLQELGKLDASIRREFSERHELSGGVEWMHDRYRGTNRIRDIDGNTASTGVLWTQYSVHPVAPLNIVAGVRVDRHSNFGTAVSPKIAATMRASGGLSAHLSFGRGFRAPDLGQLYYRFLNPTNFYQVIGNPHLSPERSGSWQVGADLNRAQGRVGVNYFHNDITNLIESVSLGTITSAAQLAAISATEGIDAAFDVQLDRLLFIYKNVTHARTEGVELEGEARLPFEVRASGSYTFLTAVDVATKLRLTGRNRHQGNFRADWTPRHLGGFRVNLRGSFYDAWIVSRSASSGAETKAKAFALWDAAISKPIVRGVELFVAIDNLTDSQDPNTGQTSAAGTALPIYRPEIGRSFRGGVRWSWDR